MSNSWRLTAITGQDDEKITQESGHGNSERFQVETTTKWQLTDISSWLIAELAEKVAQ